MKVHPINDLQEFEAPSTRSIKMKWPGPIALVRLHLSALGGDGFLGTLAKRCKAQELRERLKAMWSTLGVVSALLAGVGLPTVIGSGQAWSSSYSAVPTVDKVIVYATVGSFGLSFSVVMMCTMLVYSIDMMPTDDHIRTYVKRFQYMSDMSTVCFIGSIVAMIVGCIASIYSNYGLVPFIALLSYFAALMVFLGLSFGYMHTFNALTIMECRRELRQKVVPTPGELVGEHDMQALHQLRPPARQPSQQQQQQQPSDELGDGGAGKSVTAAGAAAGAAASSPGSDGEDPSDADVLPYGVAPSGAEQLQTGLAVRSGVRLMR